MSFIESSANTLIRFTGLGIVCFNETKKRGEIAAIRDGKHTLSLKIQQPQFLDGAEKDVIVYKNLAVYENLPDENVEIEIKAVENPEISGFEIYQTGENFDRLNNENFNDFRWIVDLNEFHGENLAAQNDEQKFPLTKIFIADGLFYTHQLDTELYFEKIARGENGDEKNRETFGNVAETIGVKIGADKVLFKIKIGETEETHSLENVSGLPYRIEIKNIDHNEGANYSDMPDYYKYVAGTDGEKFDLEPITEEDENIGGGVTGKQFCHPVRADLETIENL